MNKQSSHLPDDEPVIALTHVYNAPRPLIWELFTTPEHLVHWWGPDGFSIEHRSADICSGGHWSFVMIAPDGTRYDDYHQFVDVRPMDLISYRHGEFENDPDAFFSTITFTDLGEKTEVRMHMRFADMTGRANVLGFGADRLGLQTMAKAETYLVEQGMLQ